MDGDLTHLRNENARLRTLVAKLEGERDRAVSKARELVRQWRQCRRERDEWQVKYEETKGQG